MTSSGSSNEDQRRRVRAALAAKAEDRRRRLRAALAAKAKEALGQLDDSERASLRGLRPRMMKLAIPKHHETKLAGLGLVDQRLGGLVLTPVGEMAARMI